MKTGTYRAADGTLVRVERTATGYLVHLADGTTTAIGGVR